MWNTEKYTEAEWIEINHGRMCPNSDCKSNDIKYMGCTPDGMSANCAYDCNTCKTTWEGY